MMVSLIFPHLLIIGKGRIIIPFPPNNPNTRLKKNQPYYWLTFKNHNKRSFDYFASETLINSGIVTNSIPSCCRRGII